MPLEAEAAALGRAGGARPAEAVLDVLVGSALVRPTCLLLCTRHVMLRGVIKSFADRAIQQLFQRRRVMGLPPDIHGVALRKLRLLDAATRLDSLRVPPGNRLEALKGDRKGQWSIRINSQWRICFKWMKGYAEDIEIIDYH